MTARVCSGDPSGIRTFPGRFDDNRGATRTCIDCRGVPGRSNSTLRSAARRPVDAESIVSWQPCGNELGAPVGSVARVAERVQGDIDGRVHGAARAPDRAHGKAALTGRERTHDHPAPAQQCFLDRRH